MVMLASMHPLHLAAVQVWVDAAPGQRHLSLLDDAADGHQRRQPIVIAYMIDAAHKGYWKLG